jgi:hypothetical protein
VKPIVWSYGGGVQTVAILALILQGRLPKPELAIFADTGRERSSTWRYLRDHALPIMQQLGIRFEVASHELSTVDLYAHNGDLLMPAFINAGKLPTFCSDKWKKMVVRRRLRELGYGPDKPVIQWLGMSLDEIERMKDSDVQWIENAWPLVFDVPLRRIECETIIERAGLPIPSKSACWMCPHMNDVEWAEIKLHDPADFAKAIELDAEIRAADTRGGVYLHKSLLPIGEVEFVSREELPLFECANSCWT